MLPTTLDATRAVLKADPSLTATDRARILSALRNHGKAAESKTNERESEPRLIRRSEAARRLGASLRSIDAWSKAGLLHKVRLPGRIRSFGFRETEVNKLIEGGGY